MMMRKIMSTKLQFAVAVSDNATALLREDAVLNNILKLIEIGLDSLNDELYDVTLALHEVTSFHDECNRSYDTTGLYPFMAMAVSNTYQLCHVYDMTMKNTTVHNITN